MAAHKNSELVKYYDYIGSNVHVPLVNQKKKKFMHLLHCISSLKVIGQF